MSRLKWYKNTHTYPNIVLQHVLLPTRVRCHCTGACRRWPNPCCRDGLAWPPLSPPFGPGGQLAARATCPSTLGSTHFLLENPIIPLSTLIKTLFDSECHMMSLLKSKTCWKRNWLWLSFEHLYETSKNAFNLGFSWFCIHGVSCCQSVYSFHSKTSQEVSTSWPHLTCTAFTLDQRGLQAHVLHIKDAFLPPQSSSSLYGEIGLAQAERFITQALRTPREQIRAEF